MSDLTYWLKDAASILRSNGTETHAAKVAEAADLIDALMKALKEIAAQDMIENCLYPHWASHVARTTLAKVKEPNHE